MVPGHGLLRKNSRMAESYAGICANPVTNVLYSFGVLALNARAISGSRGRIAEYFSHNL